MNGIGSMNGNLVDRIKNRGCRWALIQPKNSGSLMRIVAVVSIGSPVIGRGRSPEKVFSEFDEDNSGLLSDEELTTFTNEFNTDFRVQFNRHKL